MATMVKEKRREKKKSKEKHAAISSLDEDLSVINLKQESHDVKPDTIEEITSTNAGTSHTLQDTITSNSRLDVSTHMTEYNPTTVPEPIEDPVVTETSQNVKIDENLSPINAETKTKPRCEPQQLQEQRTVEQAYDELNATLDRMAIPSADPNIDTGQLEQRLQSPEAYLTEKTTAGNLSLAEQNIPQTTEISQSVENSLVNENIIPSAPVFEEEVTQLDQREDIPVTMKSETRRLQSMSLEEAVRVFGGKEMEEIRVMGEREEALVEAGPISGPEHPLVDLLATFRSSLKAADRERVQLKNGYIEEEKFRNNLWKIEQRKTYASETCQCGASVKQTWTYMHAELMKERLPVARMRLESLLRDLQESYCHHQHATLLAYCQIEELISETIKSNKNEIREALALVLQALRLADSGVEVLSAALQRWATILADALVDHRDVRQLIHLLQHLFRQSRSVRWAESVIRLPVNDMSSAARAVAILDMLLTKPKLETAAECTEEEVWEEVDECGDGSAVSEGRVRERDLLAVIRAWPLRTLIATMVGLCHADISKARPQDWSHSGRDVIRSSCATRALLDTLYRGITAHVHYKRLHKCLRKIAVDALHCLAGLHLHCRSTYIPELKVKIESELEACFIAGSTLLESREWHRLPASLLRDDVAREYCTLLIVGLHDTLPQQLLSAPIELPVLECDVRVTMVAQAAIDRITDHQLASMVLDFLTQTVLKRGTPKCKCSCEAVARQALPRLLTAHPYLHMMALHNVADLCQTQPLDSAALSPLSVARWRPSTGEVQVVLDHWAQGCMPLVQHLLTSLDYTPHTGISLESQLSIGSWLCKFQKPNTPEWAWLVLRRLNVHRATWGLPLDAPGPEDEPTDLFGSAYAVLATSWGHCVPLICTSGVSALCRLAAARPREAVHCLGLVMVAMAQSPESLAYTPQFTQLLSTLLWCGPSWMQRALGLGVESGRDMLLTVLLAHARRNQYPNISTTSLISSWLHALWQPSLPSYPLLDTTLLACRQWSQFDSHAVLVLQTPNYKEHITTAVRNASSAPLLCECVLRNAHAHREVRTGLNARLFDALHRQRMTGERIHVDNALKQIGCSTSSSSEELVVYQTATAVLTAPLDHPSHLTLWRLLLHIYLQRPPESLHESTPPIGPLFFSGLTKSRTLSQLRSRLTETAKYHRSEVETLKASQEDCSQSPSPSTPSRSDIHTKKIGDDEDILPAISIRDLTGQSECGDHESASSEESEGDNCVEEVTFGAVDKIDVKLMIQYHTAAEKMVLDFSRWLSEGDKVRAMPHHADIARYIPEPALEVAWNSALSRRRPAPCPADTPPSPTPPPRAPHTPLQATVKRLMRIKERGGRRIRKPTIESHTEDINFHDTRQVLRKVDEHLTALETLSREWANEVQRLSTLDGQLLSLVTALRVSQPLQAVKKKCGNRCAAVTLVPPRHLREWSISPSTASGVKENRRQSRATAARLARPRHSAAAAAEQLLAIARHVQSPEAAVGIAELSWRCAMTAGVCAPAQSAITALGEQISERWLSHNGYICAELITKWCKYESNSVQQSLVGVMVQPRRLSPDQWPVVYEALLKANLPSHTAFSYLSKFEMSRLSTSVDASQRRELLEALLTAAQRWGFTPAEEHFVLLELMGMHSCALLTPSELSAHILRCAHTATQLTLPPQYCSHLRAAVDAHANQCSFDQLGNLLRDLGARWWEARSALKGRPEPKYGQYAAHITALLHSLMRVFVAAAIYMSYAPERVSMYAWSALQESWSPWVWPSAMPPLLPSSCNDEYYTTVLAHFRQCLLQIMRDCPGTEATILQQVFEWSIQAYTTANARDASQESRVQVSALLGELAALPWTEHQWITAKCLHTVAQILPQADKELLSWCSATWRRVSAEALLAGVQDDHVAVALATVLYVFTTMPQHTQALEEAARLPWLRLPEMALEEALNHFFAQHHNPALPYHDLPQFSLILSASELHTPPNSLNVQSGRARDKRALAVSLWTRAACSPALSAHVTGHCERVLDTITQLAPQIEASVGELEELLGRALIILGIEPAAASALPVCQRWVRSAPLRVVAASVSAVATLTTLEYFATLADDAVRAFIKHTESGGWSKISSRWSCSHWRELPPLLTRARLHAAYGVLRAHQHDHRDLRAAFVACGAADVQFIENEEIVALWICAACRMARSCGAEGEEAECAQAARALLARWAEEPRLSLFAVVTRTGQGNTPTAKHRLLSRLALCILSNTSDSMRAYEAACSAVLGSSPGDVLHWGRQAQPKRLVRLAMRLFPNCDSYFKDELDFVPEES